MLEYDKRSTRILFDMQACQTAGSAKRGVGRYSQAMFAAIAEASYPRDIHALGALQHPFPLTLDGFPENRKHLVGTMPDWNTARDFDGGEQDSLDSHALSTVIGRINPDVVHISHIFEGYGDRVPLPNFSGRPTGQVMSATLYDLIALRFSDHYFKDARFKRWYMQRLKWLRHADLLLAISESSRQDAIDLLGLDPCRIVTIHGGISSHFKPVTDGAAARERLSIRYGLNRQCFVLYTGGDDHRKNLQGAIEGYAALPPERRENTQLVIVCAIETHRKAMYLDVASKAGVEKDDLLFVGFIPEDDLVALYATCDLFVFPSLYEGLGLPVLEAMACGAPVIAANNSSLRELVPHADAFFDASDPNAIAASMTRVLSEPSFADQLRRQGLAQASRFTWDRSAKIALEAFDTALRQKRETGASTAQLGWLKRQRIAMFTPLPPCRSGIADYNAQFLPFLAEHFDIDLYVDGYKVSDEALNAVFRIFDAKDFRASAGAYDAILYEFGNSEFHVHMLPLLAEFPGVVGLHDAFLSGMMGYLEFNLGEKDRYAREMLAAHAGQARRLLAPVAAHPNAIETSMVDLPCTKGVLDKAIGVIGHSSFSLNITRQHYAEGFSAPFRVIPQMILRHEAQTGEQIAATRMQLGFQTEDFIVVSFGHVTWTKMGDRLLEAFLSSDLAADPRCHLIFAGELAKDDFGLALHDRIRKSGFGDRVKVTGYLSAMDYESYLRITDVAVQLRLSSREGASRAALDCLAHGIPLLINDVGSFKEFPGDVVVKLSEASSTSAISSALETLRHDQELRGMFRDRALGYVREHHDPRLCAAQYAAAIAEFTARHAETNGESQAARMAPHLAGCSRPMQAAAAAADFVDTCSTPKFERARLVIDVSHIASEDNRTGIQRVVRETVRAAYLSNRPGFTAVAVERAGTELVEATRWLDRERLLLPFENDSDSRTPLILRPGDHLLMLDSSWAQFDEFEPVFANARAARVPITTAVYDLLPITLPPGNFVAGGKEWFEGWLRKAIKSSDNLICISRATANELTAYIKQYDLSRDGLKVGHWHLGANIPVTKECAIDSLVRSVVAPYALMVGTIEPRKNHAIALDAFERLWDQDCNLSLVIAGKPAWMVEELMHRFRTHKLRNKKLFVFESVGDAEIACLYERAATLLFLSKGEGFGLPLIEAAQHGAPIICSDIPAFREVAGDHASYVKVSDAISLYETILSWQIQVNNGADFKSTKMPRLNWDQSFEQLFSQLTAFRYSPA